MRCALPLLALLVGCTGLVRPTDLKPAPHPLLEGLMVKRVGTRARPVPQARERRSLSDGEPAMAPGRRGKIRAELARVCGQRRIAGERASDLGLIKATFGGLELETEPETAASAAHLRRYGRPRSGRAKVGDLVFFHRGYKVPAVGVVHDRLSGGVLEICAVTRGAARMVRADVEHPTERRRGGRIVNSFLRPRRKSDRSGATYLAGGLVMEIRTLLD